MRFAKPEPITQPVNRKFDGLAGEVLGSAETATFRFTLSNDSVSTVRVTGGEVVIDKVTKTEHLFGTMLQLTSIDHEGHTEVRMKNPSVGDCVSIPVNLTVASRAKREFTVWFRSQLPDVSILYLTGRLRLYHEGGSVTSEPLEIVIHSDSWDMLPPEQEPAWPDAWPDALPDAKPGSK